MNDRKIGFDTREDAFKFLEQSRRQNDKIKAVLSDEQKSVTWGCCWVRFWEDLAIFGRVTLLDDVVAEETRGIPKPNGDPEHDAEVVDAVEEATSIVALVIKSEQDGYVYGWCYSAVEVTGEIGSTHRGNLWPIDEALFQHAMERGWEPDQFRPIFRLELASAYRHYVDWARSLPDEVFEAEDAMLRTGQEFDGGDPHESR